MKKRFTEGQIIGFQTDSNHGLPVFPNLYENVMPMKPDIVWVVDITYIRIESGFCYSAAILDACSRKVVGYAISRRIDSQRALAALEAAFARRKPAPTHAFTTAIAAANPDSTGRRNIASLCRAYHFIRCLGWRMPAKCLSWTQLQR